MKNSVLFVYLFTCALAHGMDGLPFDILRSVCICMADQTLDSTRDFQHKKIMLVESMLKMRNVCKAWRTLFPDTIIQQVYKQFFLIDSADRDHACFTDLISTAIKNERVGILLFCMQSGIAPDKDCKTVLHHIVASPWTHKLLQVFQQLKKYVPNIDLAKEINSQDSAGETVLHILAREHGRRYSKVFQCPGQYELIKNDLIVLGADERIRNKNKKTAQELENEKPCYGPAARVPGRVRYRGSSSIG